MINVVKNIILFLVIFASIYSQELQLSIGNVNEQQGSFDLLFDTQVDVQGFELNINGVEIISGESEYFNYDKVVLATHANEALSIIDNPTDQ